jgi:hypothetical protein
MKKSLLIWGLVILLIGVLAGGSAVAIHAKPVLPTLLVTINTSVSPSMLTVTGQNWSPSTDVDIYLDPGVTPDEDSHVAIATASVKGIFIKTIPLANTSLGNHTLLAVQNALQATATFRISATDMNYITFKNMQESLNTIQQGMEDAITAEAGHEYFDEDDYYHGVIGGHYDTVRHVSLTLKVRGLNHNVSGGEVGSPDGGDHVNIKVKFIGGYGPGSPEVEGDGNTCDLAVIDQDGVYHYAFDAQLWRVDVDITTFDPEVWMGWNLTTYGPQYSEPN